jgi:hypothetical protein
VIPPPNLIKRKKKKKYIPIGNLKGYDDYDDYQEYPEPQENQEFPEDEIKYSYTHRDKLSHFCPKCPYDSDVLTQMELVLKKRNYTINNMRFSK